jgi:lipopolysaccharide transport system ATP-binding protein
MSNEPLIIADGVSKKFCRSLKRSLWYGVQDVVGEIVGRKGHLDVLRENEFWAVQEVSFELGRGQCLGLIGPNGAGKSTLLKMLNGLIKPDQGRITMRGRVGALIELGAGFNPILTGKENIYINGSVLGFTKKEIDAKFDEIIEFAELQEFVETPVQNYSSGMRVRLGFSIAAQLEPDILIIDEVLAVGDLGFRQKCFQKLSEKKEEGTSILLVSHNMVDILRLADDGMLLDAGKRVFLGDAGDACAHYNILLSRGNQRKGDKSKYWIESVRLLNGHHGSNHYETGDDIEIEINVECREPFPQARMNFHIDSAKVRLNSTSTLASGQVLDFNEGSNTVYLTLKNNDFLKGGYMLHIDLYGMKMNEFYDHTEPVEFYITGPEVDMYGFGEAHIIRVDHEWRRVSGKA